MIKFLTLSFLILTIFIGSPTAKGDVSFDLPGATKESYTSFITQLRKALPTKGTVCNIPVLPSTASGLQGFTFISLTNYDEKTITVAMNVTNVYIVAYRTGDVSYFFEETPAEAFKLLFQGTTKITLPYSGNYDRLQSVVGKKRDYIELGLPALSSAITNLFYDNYKTTAAALLVLIQSTAEAARFKYIEQEVAQHANNNFLPNQAVISLENNWGALSKQIQIACNGNGQFKNPVELVNIDGERFYVTNTSSLVVKKNIKLLLYYKVSVDNDNDIPTTLEPGAIRMPVNVDEYGTTPNSGYKMGRKLVNNGHGNYVTV